MFAHRPSDLNLPINPNTPLQSADQFQLPAQSPSSVDRKRGRDRSSALVCPVAEASAPAAVYRFKCARATARSRDDGRFILPSVWCWSVGLCVRVSVRRPEASSKKSGGARDDVTGAALPSSNCLRWTTGMHEAGTAVG